MVILGPFVVVFGGDKHDGAEGFGVHKAGVIEGVGVEGVGPASAAAEGANEEVFGVAGVFFAKENLEVTGIETAIPSDGVGELGGFDGIEGAGFWDVGLLHPGRVGEGMESEKKSED